MSFRVYSLNTVVLHSPELFAASEMQLVDEVKEFLSSKEESLEDTIVSVGVDEKNPVSHVEGGQIFIRINGRVFPPPKRETEIKLSSYLEECFKESGVSKPTITEDESSGILKFTVFLGLIELPSEVSEPKEDAKENAEEPPAEEPPAEEPPAEEPPAEEPKDTAKEEPPAEEPKDTAKEEPPAEEPKDAADKDAEEFLKELK